MSDCTIVVRGTIRSKIHLEIQQSDERVCEGVRNTCVLFPKSMDEYVKKAESEC